MEDFAFELEWPDRSGYRFYPVVHVSSLKKVRDHGERPTRKLVTVIDETGRFDFDEELLPKDIYESGEAIGRYEAEAIVDEDLPLSLSISRTRRRFLVK